MESESLNRFMNRRILVLSHDTPVATAARALHEKGFGSAVISDRHGHMVGIVTDRDLACSVLAFHLSPKTPVSEVMSASVITARPTTSLSDVITMMEENAVRRVPIVKKDGSKERCIGMITLDDLIISEYAKDIRCLAKIVRSQITRAPRSSRHSDRKEERREQVLSHFYKVMAKSMDLPKPMAERLTFCLLKKIVQRLPYAEADHFIAQLPSLLQEDLRSLPAGPDKQIRAESVVSDISAAFQVDRFEAREFIHGFWSGLEELVDEGLLAHLEVWLPEDLRELLIATPGLIEDEWPPAYGRPLASALSS